MNKLNYTLWVGSRTIASKESCAPTLILALFLNQTLTLTGGGGNFPWRQLSGYPHYDNKVTTLRS